MCACAGDQGADMFGFGARTTELLVAFHRFGLGVRPGVDDVRAVSKDPRGFVAAELAKAAPGLMGDPQLLPTPDLVVILQAQQKRDAEARAARPMAPMQAPSAPGAMKAPAPSLSSPMKAPAPVSPMQERIREDVQARLRLAHAPGCGVAERMVAFWSNHFCVSAAQGQHVAMLAGAFEREAIRPHALGRFGAMLKAVEQHPAMLIFLDNQASTGPNSNLGQKTKRGLNENLARELLELHTLGVNGGYSQADVTSLARMLTGWRMAGNDGRLGRLGLFAFDAVAHEPGAQILLGKTYPDEGRAQAEKAIDDIWRKPATAMHIATKFASHFIADTPPRALVDALAKSFRDTGGDLKALATTLIASDEAWKAPLTKIRSPYEFYIAASRLLNKEPDPPQRAMGLLNQMGQPLWSPPGPDGFADTNAAWANPNAIKTRFDVATSLARANRTRDPRDLLEQAFGASASDETRRAIARAESHEQGLALLLMSPEFLRR